MMKHSCQRSFIKCSCTLRLQVSGTFLVSCGFWNLFAKMPMLNSHFPILANVSISIY